MTKRVTIPFQSEMQSTAVDVMFFPFFSLKEAPTDLPKAWKGREGSRKVSSLPFPVLFGLFHDELNR